jgi:hypothetical protein
MRYPMLFFKDNASIIFYTKPVNLHKGFELLASIAQNELGLRLVPDLYVLFCNRKRDIIKVLYRDGENLACWSKRIGCTLTFKYDEAMITFDQKGFADFLKKRCFRNVGNRFKAR